MQELHCAASSQLFRTELGWTCLASDVMSDLANAVFSGQLLGHVLAGEDLTGSEIFNSSMNAHVAASLVADDNISELEAVLIELKTAQHVMNDGDYSPSAIHGDLIDSDLAEGMIHDLI